MDQKFDLGQVFITAAANEVLERIEILAALERHLIGDWGDLEREDRQANDQALLDGTRLLSAYTDRWGVKYWVITEWDRSVTTILLPSDY